MSKNRSSAASKEPKIIIRCEKCRQKLRIPLRGGKLHVTCPACRHEFDYASGEEFRLIIPTEVKGAVIGLVLIVLGLAVPSLLYSLHGNSPPAFATFVFMMMAPAGALLLIVSDILVVMNRKDIARFWPIGRIMVSGQGIAAYRKDGSTDVLIGWRQIKAIRLRYLKRMFWGLVETGREPAAVEFDLVDGSTLKMPLHLILKAKDRLRMVSTISRYVSFQTMA